MAGKKNIGDPEFLKKRIPNNPKYQHIRTRLDTGSSMTKYIEKLEEIKRNYRYKKDELFKRIKIATFAQLALQVASVSDELLQMTNEELQRLEDSSSIVSDTDTELLTNRTNGKGSPEETPSSPINFIDNNMGAGESICTSRSTLQSVISGVGELDLGKGAKGRTDSETTPGPRTLDKRYPDCPYLLLDVRDRDAYEQCHMIGAFSYPITMLSRTMNPFTNEILEFKNAHGKIIILYDEDERLASQAATTMCERGFENVFMLSGGLKVIAQKFPEGLNTGSFPATCLSPPVQVTSARKRSTPKVPSSPAQNKWRFSTDDLQKIEEHLEETMAPSDSASRLSRLSTGRQDSKTSNSWSNQAPSAAGSIMSSRSLVSAGLQTKPWK